MYSSAVCVPDNSLTVCAMVLAYVSAIQDISLSPVLMSGAGTSMPGPGEETQVAELNKAVHRVHTSSSGVQITNVLVSYTHVPSRASYPKTAAACREIGQGDGTTKRKG